MQNDEHINNEIITIDDDDIPTSDIDSLQNEITEIEGVDNEIEGREIEGVDSESEVV